MAPFTRLKSLLASLKPQPSKEKLKYSIKISQPVNAEYSFGTESTDTTSPKSQSFQEQQRVKTFGTFGGVFTPSFLTIIGVIMYLRFSWVVANAGLFQTLMIVIIANAVTFVTALSVSSIASNEQMETGGAYFMVSRVLGFKAGGGIGIPLYLSQGLSVALYIIGFSESFHNLFPHIPSLYTPFITLAILTVVSLFGAKFMVKIQFLILAIILMSFVSIGLGFRFGVPGTPVLYPQYTDGNSFWTVFAVFFPAVTGILAGVSMSGDLKNPRKSIPKGTLLSVVAGFVVYLLVPVMLAFTLPRQELFPSSALTNASQWPILVSLGVFGATLSSAIGSILAAPRTLQALGIDRVLPSVFGKGVGKTQEPLVALGFTLGISFVVLFLGNLNLIAEVLTMFFLTTYGMLNLSAGLERIISNPSYRPAIKVHWSINFIGALGCFAIMFLINPVSTIIALGMVILIFVYLNQRKAAAIRQTGVWEGLYVSILLAISRKIERNRNNSGKNWRPMIQIFASNTDSHKEMIKFGNLTTVGGGILSIYGIIPPSQRALKHHIEHELIQLISSEKTVKPHENATISIIETENLYDGVVVASQAAGFASNMYNTVLLGLPTSNQNDLSYAKMIGQLVHINRNIILFNRGTIALDYHTGPIQVWWGGQQTNVRLMLILAYLVQSNLDSKRSILLSTIVSNEEEKQKAEEQLIQALDQFRIPADISVIINDAKEPVQTVIQNHSQDAALVFLGMARPGEKPEKSYVEQLRTFTMTLGETVFVMHNISDLEYQ